MGFKPCYQLGPLNHTIECEDCPDCFNELPELLMCNMCAGQGHVIRVEDDVLIENDCS